MPTLTSERAQELLRRFRDKARGEGFSHVHVTAARLPRETGQRLHAFLGAGRHGDMDWMAEEALRRASPDAMWPQARSAIVVALPYTPVIDPMARLADRASGNISVHALNRDYHEMLKGKLKRLAQWLAQQSGAEVKVFVDTAPLMEKPLAEQAGLGWQGKHTNLVSRQLGSWFFLGSILTRAALPVDAREADHCGTCRACLDICPTAAFPAPYQLDARRCISYLTIEHRGHIAREFRVPMGNRIYGCDDCLAVCPWNKFAEAARELKLQARDDLLTPPLAELLRLDEAAFRKLFSGSPVKRIGHTRFLRNCLIAAGNSGNLALLPIVERLLLHASPLVRAMAVWAHGQLAGGERHRYLASQCLADEADADVRGEWATQAGTT